MSWVGGVVSGSLGVTRCGRCRVLMLVDEVDHLEEEVASGLEGLGADLVEGVFGGVVVAVGVGGVVGAVVVVDDVEDGDATLVEGDGVVFDGGVVFGECGRVAGVFGGLDEEGPELGGGVGVVVDVEVLVADHVGEEEGLDVGEGAVLGPLGGEVAGAVEGVLRGPGLDGFFAVVEEQDDAVAGGRVGAEVLADLDEQGGGAGAVVGADEGDVLEGVVGFVVGGEDDDAVPFGWVRAGEVDDVVADGLEAGGGGGGEGIDVEAVVGELGGEVGLDEVFGGEVAGGGVETLGGYGEELFGEGVGGGAGDPLRGVLGVGQGGEEEDGEDGGDPAIHRCEAAMNGARGCGFMSVCHTGFRVGLRRLGWT